MKRKEIIRKAVINALATALYITLIASFLFYAPKIFDQEKPDTVFAPIAMLLLFVFSAAFTGVMIFGEPVLWYLDGRKEHALSLLVHTLAVFFIVLLITFSLVYLSYNRGI